MVRIDYSKPGAQEYTNSWVEMLAGWGIDYIKIDGMQDSNAADVKAHLDATDLQKYLENSEILAVDQDSIAAKRVLNTGNQQVFAKREPNGDAIVGLFNTGGKAEEVSVPASTEDLPKTEAAIPYTTCGPARRRKQPIPSMLLFRRMG